MPFRQDLATGEWIEVDAQGNPVRGAVGQIIPDASAPYEGPKAAADARRAEADATVATSTVDAEIRKANAQADLARAQASKTIAEQNSGGQQLTPGQQKADQTFATDYAAWAAGGGMAGLENKLKVLSEALDLLEGNDTITGPIFGRLPKFIQQMIDPRSQDVRADVERSIQETLRQTLGAQFTAKEGESILARTFDPTQQEASNARRARNLIQELRSQGIAKDSAARYFEQNGTIAGWTPPLDKGNAMTNTRLLGGTEQPQAAGFGAEAGVDQYPPEMLDKHAQLVQQIMAQNGGRLDPQAYAQARASLNQEFGYSGDPQADMAWAEGVNGYLDKGGKTIPTDITPAERQLSGTEQFRNNLVNNPLGAAATGYADMMSLGVPSALAGDQMAALSDSQPLPMMGGQIGGAITGTGMIGRIGREAVTRALPQQVAGRILQTQGRGRLARTLATDAAYSGGYGGVTGQDPLATGALGVGGSLLGQGAGKVLGKVAGGVTASAPVQALRARGIPLTVGQSLGGFAKSIEDKATSIPLVGDIINTRRLQGLQAFNREAFDEAGKPIGARVGSIGREGTEALFDQTSSAYDNATAGVNVPLDGQYAADFTNVAAMGQQLPDDLRARFGLALNNRVNPINDAGELTGESYQQAVRGLKSYKAENVKPGFEQDYRDALTMAQDALTGQMERGGGEGVVSGLRAADGAYRNAKTLQDAIGRAKGGSQSGELYTFTPSQLQGAVAKTQGKYPGEMSLGQLADEGQAVLPSRIPDSGTAGRGAQMLLGGGLITAGAGGGAAMGGGEGAQTGAIGSALATLALLAGGTKGGQKALTKLLLDRPDALKTAGKIINTRKGLFGRATLPLTVAEY